MARASANERGYGAKWRKESAAFLALPENQRCACGCGQRATIVDHKQPHRGDQRLFWSRANWQGLAKACHDGAKQREEVHGYSDRVGLDGLPADPRHPFNRVEAEAPQAPGGSKVRGRTGGRPVGESNAQLVSRQDLFARFS